jgi:hypothetical protein
MLISKRIKLYSNIYIIVKNMSASFLKLEMYRQILVIPVSSATTENGFSTVKIIKTYKRQTTTGKRLHNLPKYIISYLYYIYIILYQSKKKEMNN